MHSQIKARNRQLHDYERKEGKIHFESNPVQVQIEVTNRCNLRCSICARPYYDNSLNPLGDMSLDILEKIDPFLFTAEEVVIGGYGEPLLGKTFLPILRRCLHRGAATSLITNGALMTEELVQTLVASRLDRLIFSMDGVKDETLARLRGISVNGVAQGIKRIGKIKK